MTRPSNSGAAVRCSANGRARTRKLVALSAVLATTGVGLGLGSESVDGAVHWLADRLQSPKIAGEPLDALHDSDGDLLPDRVEWVLQFDPEQRDTDGDGASDFLAAAQLRRSFDPPGTPRAVDDEMRVVVSASEAGGVSSVWVHFLFRFVAANASELRSIEPYLDVWGQRFPIGGLLTSSPISLNFEIDAREGLFCICSFQLASEDALRALLPCTLGATAVVGTRTIHSGAFLQDAAGTTTVLMAADEDKGIVLQLSPAVVEDPFWTSSRVCVMQLEIISSSPAGAMCEVRNSECMSSGRLSCPPTCLSSRGRTMFFPNGLSTVTGGGR